MRDNEAVNKPTFSFWLSSISRKTRRDVAGKECGTHVSFFFLKVFFLTKISVQFDTYFAAAATAVRQQLLISAQREILELFSPKVFLQAR